MHSVPVDIELPRGQSKAGNKMVSQINRVNQQYLKLVHEMKLTRCTQYFQQHPNRRYKSEFHTIVNYHCRTEFHTFKKVIYNKCNTDCADRVGGGHNTDCADTAVSLLGDSEGIPITVRSQGPPYRH